MVLGTEKKGATSFAAFEAQPGSGDIVIIGAGLAGLFTALKLAPLPVTVIAAAPLGEGASSMWAQGGIAAAVGEGDSTDKHAADTIEAGGGIVDTAVAKIVAHEGPDRIRDLLTYGVPFDRDLEGHYILSKEAAHSEKRVVRVSGDRAGAAIMQALIAAVRATPSIRVLEGYEADDLISSNGRVEGVRLIRAEPLGGGSFVFVPASAVVLATGGVGALFALTTNPSYAKGEAIAMAARAGAVIADPEFVQFHPTAIDAGIDPAPLATEALRGEGAILVNSDGHRFMLDIDPRGELAPRDIVARTVHNELLAGRSVYLDCRESIGAHFEAEFPTVWSHCQRAGIDPTKELIPVAPAEHYHMGGIATDVRGRTSLVGLWAVGEVASTGLHGANRLASNSLLEAVVFGARVAADIRSGLQGIRIGHIVEPRRVSPPLPVDMAIRDKLMSELRNVMTTYVGVERSAKGLRTALLRLKELEAVSEDDTVLANMILTARLIAMAALFRRESRGGHYRVDYPETNPALAQRTFMTIDDLEMVEPIATPPPLEIAPAACHP
ncbi:L-aspartate oxidase [Hyphomicrobium methylovorum]|uniref:L-aspartate oxidase n=1 Tax=Hyphomicrobium methylovorum TaxID=84 RepID=UPI0015E68918|nr:L-aspartate oxidase [Hyphomicrobium methylovorum]MBA2127276.1 L-aspartate oxidase [Hyphomicrobium methylovorum]